MKVKGFLLFTLILTVSYLVAQNIEKRDELGNPISESLGSNFYEYVPGEILIKFKENVLSSNFLNSTKQSDRLSELFSQNEQNFLIRTFRDNSIYKVVKKLRPSTTESVSRSGKKVLLSDFYNLVLLKVDKSLNIIALCEQINEMDEVEYAEPNHLMFLHDNPPNDPSYNLQGGFEQFDDRDIDANRAWDFNTGIYNIKVAVIDNGIDYHNIDLGDGDFGFEGAKVRGGWDYINNDADPDYTENALWSHGTECAGIIGALRNNFEGVAGLAGGDGDNNIGVQLFALKVGPVECADGTFRCLDTSKIIDAIIEASVWSPEFGYGCHVLNNSYGSAMYNESMRNAVRTAAQNNVIFVASKGNNDNDDFNYPSDYDASWVVSVGASSPCDERKFPISCDGENEWGSNFGNNIDVSAPGARANVFTTTVGGYRAFSGTSAAAPHVSGLAALILSETFNQGTSLHHEDVEWIIKVSSEDVNNAILPGYDDEMGHGRINAGRALEMMNLPWEITHHSVIGGTIENSTSWFNIVLQNPGGGLPSAVYSVRRHEVQRVITLPFYTGNNFVWGRGTNATTGWSAASPNYQLGFCDVVEATPTVATLRTFIYEVRTILGQDLGWFPTTANNVNFAYTTLGTPCPMSLNIFMEINPGTINDPVLYAASGTITASNVINPNADIIYSAGNSVTLLQGFEAREGSEFQVVADGCISGNNMGSATFKDWERKVANYKISYDNTQINSEEEELNNVVKVYPNPFSDIITFQYTLTEDSEVLIEITDILGRPIAILTDRNVKRKGLHHVNFGGERLTAGVYLFRIKTKFITNTGRIIKE